MAATTDEAEHQPGNSTSIPCAKRLTTAKARTALWGGTLTNLEDDSGKPLYIVSRWALTKSFEYLSEVERFLDHVEGLKS